jgi:hypothetical protein
MPQGADWSHHQTNRRPQGGFYLLFVFCFCYLFLFLWGSALSIRKMHWQYHETRPKIKSQKSKWDYPKSVLGGRGILFHVKELQVGVATLLSETRLRGKDLASVTPVIGVLLRLRRQRALG